MTPQLFTPLIVELHSGSDMHANVRLYFEHEMKFSQKIRGMQLFSHLYKFFFKHRWLKGNKYTVDEQEQQILTFTKHEEEKDTNKDVEVAEKENSAKEEEESQFEQSKSQSSMDFNED